MISIIFDAIAAIPVIATAIKQIVSFIRQQIEEAERRRLKEDIIIAKDKKDTSDIEELIKRKL
jgi:hypothetical protein